MYDGWRRRNVTDGFDVEDGSTSCAVVKRTAATRLERSSIVLTFSPYRMLNTLRNLTLFQSSRAYAVGQLGSPAMFERSISIPFAFAAAYWPLGIT